MFTLYKNVSLECSRLITNRYSTSFSLGIRMFHPKFRAPIYAIYGFVRFADEIVDTFHETDQATLLEEFRLETFRAIERGISLNPVLQSFQEVVNEYGIERELIEAFLESMEMDLYRNAYDRDAYDKYIYGSAEVVGLMCLRVFCHDQPGMYDRLKAPACRLGAAFQKVNFLRDMESDFKERGRVYFPGVDYAHFSEGEKRAIEQEIREDFEAAYEGIRQLPKGARLGVYLAYVYYMKLLRKISGISVRKLLKKRMRVHDGRKVYLLLSSAVRDQFNLI